MMSNLLNYCLPVSTQPVVKCPALVAAWFAIYHEADVDCPTDLMIHVISGSHFPT
jgi:hypothetical protein